MLEPIAKPQSRRDVPKIIRRLLLTLTLLYFLPLVCLGVFQRFLVFNAQASRTRTAAFGNQAPRGARTVHLRTDAGDTVVAYLTIGASFGMASESG